MNSSGILRNRNFLLLWCGNGVSTLGTSGVRIAYPLLGLAIFGSPTLAGWMTFASSLPALLFQLPAGIVADHWNRRRTMVACELIGLAATTTAALAIIWQVPPLTVILIVSAVVEGTAAVFFAPAEVGAIRDVVNEAQRPSAFSFYEAEQPAAMLVGRALGAGLLGIARWLPFAANAASYMFCLATLSKVPAELLVPRPAEAAGEGRPWRHIGAGLRSMWSEPFLRGSTLLTGLTNIVFQVVILLVIVVVSRSGEPSWVVGLVLASAGAGGVVGSFAASWLTRRVEPAVVYAGGLWAWVALLFPIASTSDLHVLAACWSGVGAVGAISSVALMIARVRAVPDAVLGQVVGATAVITIGAVPLGAVLGGYVISGLGVRTTGWLLFFSMVVLAFLGSPFLRGHRPKRERVDPPHVVGTEAVVGTETAQHYP